ncbi:MAG: hypothetical protein ACREIH_05820 [Nitrospiraceae bacterium]
MPNRAASRFKLTWLVFFFQRPRLVVTLLLAGLFLPFLLLDPAHADVRVVTVQGEHRMGDRDTREDAIRLATEAAKRDALEQVATYLESVTVVTDLDVTKDEIRTYTAGVVLVLGQEISTSLDGDTVVLHVDLTAQVDTDEVVQAIAALRQNEDARQELVSLKAEVDQLHQDLDTANQLLAAATSPEQVKEFTEQRQELLNKAQSDALVSQAWTDWVLVTPAASPYPWVGVAQVQALLTNAGRLHPTNPHVQIVQQVITTQAALLPPQPSAPPASQVQPGAPPMPTQQIVPQQPAPSRATPLTLNEIHNAPAPQPTLPSPAPPAAQQITMPQQPAPHDPRRLTDIRQLNPFLTVPTPPGQSSIPPVGQQSPIQQGAPPSSPRKLSRMFQQTPAATQSLPPALGTQPSGTEQFPPPSLSQSPVPRRLPPSLNQIHPPLQHQFPRVPFRVAPHTPRTGPFGGGGGRGGGGGHRGGGGRR